LDRIEAMVADLVPGRVDAVDFEEAETELWNRSRLAAGKRWSVARAPTGAWSPRARAGE